MAYYYKIEVESLERLTEEDRALVKQYIFETFPRPVGKARVEFDDCELSNCGVCNSCKLEARELEKEF